MGEIGIYSGLLVLRSSDGGSRYQILCLAVQDWSILMLLLSPPLAFLYRVSFGSYIITECCLLCDQLDGCIDTLGALREKTSSNRSFAHLSNRLGGRKSDEGV